MVYRHPQKQTSRDPKATSECSSVTRVPSGFEHILNPLPPEPLNEPRLRLFVRQQPIAARTCAAGEKNRRCLDPPPILQLLIAGFNPRSKDDIKTLKHSDYVVACQLFAVPKKTRGISRALGRKRTDQGLYQQIHHEVEKEGAIPVQTMYGKTYVSPFFVERDPEPVKSPPHPGSAYHGTFSSIPSTFFVFADLRIPASGVYRLRFRLIDVSKPTLTAHAAKNFPGMNPTPCLSEHLKTLGADGVKARKTRGRRG
ncbi:hypothetical protein PRK78_007251 [Emydomyces testavorans]|uniref:Velvet domain-containing protein n=1 Tax=Emydomyces testavorans TaxID=2070801 RepID=A0AAF0DND7_9EURO|nr:hypothetical protein PRK78_007251 [Emydomyces testavorans]